MLGSKKITIFEVGPRDGLQNESKKVSLQQKIRLVSSLVDCGLKEIEVGALVRKNRVPQMADTSLMVKKIQNDKKLMKSFNPWVLVPNLKGLEKAIDLGVKNIAVFTASTDSFTKKNIGFTVKDSLREINQVVQVAKSQKIKVRAYVSTAMGCPFEGKVSHKQSISVIRSLLDLGVFQVSIGDTIGVATPKQVEKVIYPLMKKYNQKQIAVHFHDTRGGALANTLRAIDLGVRVVDSSVGGLGGCPFAPGASGNLSTEDLVYFLDGMGFQTGVDLKKLSKVSLQFSRSIKRPITSRYLQAVMNQKNKKSHRYF